MIELLQILSHIIHDILHRDIDLLHNPLVDVSYYLLDHFELTE